MKKVEKLESIVDKLPNNGILKHLFLSVRVLAAAIFRFIRDDCLMKASAISYTTVVSLIPMLTVALALLTITSGVHEQKDELFEKINSFLIQNDINIDINPYLETLGELIDAATQIGAIGFVILIFSATAVLRSLENAFNKIWGIDEHRSMLNKIIFYFFILSIAPLLFATGQGFAEKLIDMVRTPHYYSVVNAGDGTTWIAGEKGNLVQLDQNLKEIYKISDSDIDYENMKCLDNMGHDVRLCKPPKIRKEDFIYIDTNKNNIYAITREGSLLIKKENAPLWKIHRFNRTNLENLEVVRDGDYFLILENGEVLHYKPNGGSYQTVLDEALKIHVTKVLFLDDSNGYLLDESGNFWKTENGGIEFKASQFTKQGLRDILYVNSQLMYIVGESGTIFRSEDGGNQWENISHKRYTFTNIWKVDSPTGLNIFLQDSMGSILYSSDLGDHWNQLYKPVNGKLKSSMVQYDSEGNFKRMISVGEFEKIAISEWKANHYEIKALEGGESVFSIFSIMRFVVPLTGIWIFFWALYTVIPNTKVPVSASAIGAALTGLIFLLFIYAFRIYVTSFTETTMVIYKALAAIPIFLLTVYSVSVIVLLGAEITACLQHKERYLLPFSSDEEDGSLQGEFQKTTSILFHLYREQKKIQKPVAIERLEELSSFPSANVIRIIERLQQEDLVSKVDEKDEYLPNRQSEDLDLWTVYSSIFGKALVLSDTVQELPADLRQKSEHWQSDLKAKLESITFSQILS